jgi:hypothetical protein
MSEPAKDEADLIGTIAWAIFELNCSADGAAKAALAAIRAAGWAVVPQTELDDLRAENARLREALGKIAENATTPGYLLEQRRHAIWQMARAALEVKP